MQVFTMKEHRKRKSVDAELRETTMVHDINPIKKVKKRKTKSTHCIESSDSTQTNGSYNSKHDDLIVKTVDQFNKDVAQDDSCDLMLNVTSEPLEVSKVSKIKKIPSGIPKHKRRKLEKELLESDEVVQTVGDIYSKSECNEKTEEGVKLSIKGLELSTRLESWQKIKGLGSAKTAYKHLIQGDIIVKFKNSNLHEIKGYGIQCTEKVALK